MDSNSPHMTIPQLSLDVHMSPIGTDVDYFSTVLVDPVMPSASICTNVSSSVGEIPMDTSHGELENIFDVNALYVVLSSMSLPQIDTSSISFDKFMTEASHDFSSKKTLVAV